MFSPWKQLIFDKTLSIYSIHLGLLTPVEKSRELRQAWYSSFRYFAQVQGYLQSYTEKINLNPAWGDSNRAARTGFLL